MFQCFHRAIEAATPWLVGAAVGFLVIWIGMRCRRARLFANEIESFNSLAPLRKLVICVVLAICAFWCGSKDRRLLPRRLGDGAASIMGRMIEFAQPRTLPDDLSTNALAIMEFALDHTNQTAYFETTWATNLFDYTDTRNVFLFSSTNLWERRWTPLGAFTMPSGTNSCAFAVTPNDVDVAMLPWYLNTFNGMGFYRLGLDFDSDGDGIADSIETLWTLTDPVSPDSGYDGIPDGMEVENGTNPPDPDTDGDGLYDLEEIGRISVLPSFEWHDTSNFPRTYGVPPPHGIESYSGAITLPSFPSGVILHDVALSSAVVCDNGFVSLLAPDDVGMWVFPAMPHSLAVRGYNGGSFLVAPYWGYYSVQYGNTNSYICAGVLADGTAVMEFHDVKCGLYSDDGVTYQVIVPGGTGDVVRVSYLSSDVWMDGTDTVVGVQNARRTTPDGLYNLTWDFTERGPILPGTTVEYRLGEGTDPLYADSDGDGLDDYVECRIVFSAPWSADGDDDGLLDSIEVMLGTNPLKSDTDGDTLPDGWEFSHGLDPLSAEGDHGRTGDLDRDGLSNYREMQLGTDPLDADTDNDALSDSDELDIGTNPTLDDTDRDGLLDGLECSIGTNPLQPDSDSDGMNDGWEYQHRDAGFNPSVDNASDANPDNDIGADPDGDSLTNGQECEWGTNPSGMDENEDGVADGYDTDGDGVNDGAEVGQNSDPRDAADGGSPSSRVPVPFYFGDPSNSRSEKYRLVVSPVSGIGDTPPSFSWLNENYGQCESRTAMLKPGWTYEVRQEWASCRYPLDGVNYPNYDYTLSLGQNVPQNVALDDPGNLFRTDYYGGAYYGASHFPVLDAVAYLRVYAVTGVTVCAPNVFGAELDESRVLLDAENLNVKIEVAPQLTSLAQCRQQFGDSLTIKTSGTCPLGVSVSIPDEVVIEHSTNKSEIRIIKTRQQLKDLGLLPQNGEDGVEEMTVYDAGTINGNNGSNLSDSDAFAALAYQWRGKATMEMSLNLNSAPPNSRLSKSFFQAAGCELIEVVYGGKTSARKQIMNQADYFYYSGHGLHKFAYIDDDIEPSDVSGLWTNDLNCVIIAGCSVLDINDYNDNFFLDPQDHAASPGRLWAAVGPATMLGYNYSAPLDETGAPARIIGAWLRLRSSCGNVDAWMRANDNRNGRNACAIRRIDDSHVQYSFFRREKGFVFNNYHVSNTIERITR